MINQILDLILPYKLALIGSILRDRHGDPIGDGPSIFKRFSSEKNLLRYAEKFYQKEHMFLRRGNIEEKVYFYQIIPPVENEVIDIPDGFKLYFKEYSFR